MIGTILEKCKCEGSPGGGRTDRTFGFGQEELQIFRSGIKLIEEMIPRRYRSVGGRVFLV